MLLDMTQCFDPAGTAITVSAPSTNVLDEGIINGIGGNVRDMAYGTDLFLIICSSMTFAAAGAATLQIAVQVSVDNATWSTIQLSPPLSIAQLNSGFFKMPQALAGADDAGFKPRYYRLYYTVATGPFTAGTLQAYLNLGEEHPVSYAKNFTNA